MSGFQSPNYTQTPNDFFDMLPSMDETEVKVTLVMIRQTFGYHREGFKMGLNKLADAAGLSRNGAKTGAERAEIRGTFKRTNPDSQGEAEWSLAVAPATVDQVGGQPVTTPPSTVDQQVGVKESIKEKKKFYRLSEKEIQQANAQVDAMIANSKKVKYQNRDKIPEPYLVYADIYHELTKQEPTKRVLMDWLSAFSDWQSEGLRPEHIRAAWQYANRPEGGFIVGRPGSLTNTAVAMKSKSIAQKTTAPQIDQRAVETTLQALEDKWTKKYVPPPPSLRPNIRKPEREATK